MPWRLDLSDLKFITPTGLVWLESLCRANHESVEIIRPKSADVEMYLSRMRFYEMIGLSTMREYKASDDKDRFYALTRIEQALSSTSADDIVRQVGATLSPEHQVMKELLYYCVGELVANVRQHASGPGVIASQYFPKNDQVELAVADTGIGILTALQGNPILREEVRTDKEAVLAAKKARISGKTFPSTTYHNRQNMGVGLYLLSRIAASTYGYMTLWSGTAYSFQDRNKPDIIREGCKFEGTLVSVRIFRHQVYSVGDMIKEALHEADERDDDDNINFE